MSCFIVAAKSSNLCLLDNSPVVSDRAGVVTDNDISPSNKSQECITKFYVVEENSTVQLTVKLGYLEALYAGYNLN